MEKGNDFLTSVEGEWELLQIVTSKQEKNREQQFVSPTGGCSDQRSTCKDGKQTLLSKETQITKLPLWYAFTMEAIVRLVT